jgi:hypothetical protein
MKLLELERMNILGMRREALPVFIVADTTVGMEGNDVRLRLIVRA